MFDVIIAKEPTEVLKCVYFCRKKTVERLSIDIIGGTSKISVNIDHSWSKNTEELVNVHCTGWPKSNVPLRFKLIAWPLIIGSAKFVQECAGTVTGFLGIKNKEVGVTSYK